MSRNWRFEGIFYLSGAGDGGRCNPFGHQKRQAGTDACGTGLAYFVRGANGNTRRVALFRCCLSSSAFRIDTDLSPPQAVGSIVCGCVGIKLEFVLAVEPINHVVLVRALSVAQVRLESSAVRSLGPLDILAGVLGIAVVAGCLYMTLKHPDLKSPSGFGPEWECTGRGITGGDPSFCIKKELLNPANRTPTN